MRLADRLCPDWVKTGGSCAALLTTTPEGFLVGATVTTGPGIPELTAKIERQLTKKYGKAPSSGRVTTCQNLPSGVVTSETAERIWNLPGLRVVYTPVNADCSRGMLVVETAALQRLRGAEKVKQEASEPGL